MACVRVRRESATAVPAPPPHRETVIPRLDKVIAFTYNMRWIASFYVMVTVVAMVAGFMSSQVAQFADGHYQPSISILVRAWDIGQHNTKVLLALGGGNICTFGGYGAMFLGLNGFRAGRVGAVVLRRDPDVWLPFLLYVTAELGAAIVMASVSMVVAVKLIKQARMSWRQALWGGISATTLVWLAALVEASAIACLAGERVVGLCGFD